MYNIILIHKYSKSSSIGTLEDLFLFFALRYISNYTFFFFSVKGLIFSVLNIILVYTDV